MSLAFALALCSIQRTASRPELGELEHATASARITFVGRVTLPHGRPACGANVVTSAGGEARTDADGEFELVADVPCDASWVDVIASVGDGDREDLTSSAHILPAALSGTTSVGTLVMAPGTVGARWLPSFGGLPGVSGNVLAMTVFDEGAGPALYSGGSFTSAGGLEVQNIARWDGTRWSALGDGLSGGGFEPVQALVVFDDGTGAALYAGGAFQSSGATPVSRVARWDGVSWSSLGSGLDGTVRALAVFDDGSGAALYATGTFTTAGGVPANNIARWDGASWSALGNGITGLVGRALEVFDDGSGDALYVAGKFTAAGDAPASCIARWDGSSWQALGSGLDDTVLALRTFDDGNGPALYAGGRFDSAGGSPANEIARWDGASWSPLGSGMAGGRVATTVQSLLVFDSGSGASLHVGGDFTTAGGVSARGAARWNGASWAAVGDAATGTPYLFELRALAAFDRGSGPELHAGGTVWPVEGVSNGVVRLNGAQWAALGPGPGGPVQALLPVDVGGTRQMHVAGHFASMGGVPANNVALWNGSTWTPLGSGTAPGPDLHSGTVYALSRYDDGGGTDLYAGGNFESAGGVTAQGIARWNGASWSAVGSGFHGYLRAFSVFDDGSGSALYTGGESVSASRWNGTAWANLSHGMNGAVLAFAVFDDGTGPALYAGGAFTSASSGTLNHVARWTGSGWAALGSGTPGTINTLVVFDDGDGPALYAAGARTGLDAPVLRWDGTSWSSVGGGFSSDVYALATIDDGSGAALYAAGSFLTADGAAARSIARWDGASWSPLGAGLGSSCHALAQFHDDGGRALLAGGTFYASPARDSFLAKWSVVRRTVRTP